MPLLTLCLHRRQRYILKKQYGFTVQDSLWNCAHTITQNFCRSVCVFNVARSRYSILTVCSEVTECGTTCSLKQTHLVWRAWNCTRTVGLAQTNQGRGRSVEADIRPPFIPAASRSSRAGAFSIYHLWAISWSYHRSCRWSNQFRSSEPEADQQPHDRPVRRQ